MKKKTLFMGLYVLVIYIIVILSMISCTHNTTPVKTATEVINHSDKDITIETLHEGYISSGVYKVSIDSSEYIVVTNNTYGTAITKHK